MKHYITILIFLLIGCWVYGQEVVTEFNPTNPPEPSAQYRLDLQVFPLGGGSTSGEGKYTLGQNVWVRAYTSTGFQFKHWKKGDEIISTSASFYYVIKNENATLTAHYEYNPINPDEPQQENLKHKLYLEAVPSVGGYFNTNSGERHQEDASIYLRAYNNNGFVFSYWSLDGAIVSTNNYFTHTMGTEDQTLKAVFAYHPIDPEEPNQPDNTEHGLIALNHVGEKGQTLAYPIYLLNRNVEVNALWFNIEFPTGVTVDCDNVVLSSRKNGHHLVMAPVNNTGNAYQVSVSGDNKSLFGSDGILLTIPITLPIDWIAGENHLVNFSEVLLETPNGPLSSAAKAAGLSVKESEIHTIYAGFHHTKFLNRVAFTNISSETATDFYWDFGDGNTSTEKQPMHVYDKSGTYNVRLIASNIHVADDVTTSVGIDAESTWSMSGTFSLNKEKQDVKNFTSLKDFFTLVARSNPGDNLTMNTQADVVFEISYTDLSIVLADLKDKLSQGNRMITFVKDGAGGKPIISVTGIPVGDLTLLVEMFSHVILNDVELKLFGATVNLMPIGQITGQTVCSGNATQVVDFSLISTDFTYDWSLKNTPQRATGYQSSGTGNIPSMTLVNTTAQRDTLEYTIGIKLNRFTLYEFGFRVEVLYELINEPVVTSPVSGSELTSPDVNFAWISPEGATCDLYLWKAGDIMPETPIMSANRDNYYRNTQFCTYGQKYYWKVEAIGDCNTLESKIDSFTVRHLPDLCLIGIYSMEEEVIENDSISIMALISNFSNADVKECDWCDYLYRSKESVFDSNTATLVATQWRSQSISVFSSYVVSFNLTAPVDSLQTYYYYVRTDAQNHILEVDETNNLSEGVPILVKPSMLNEEEWSLLKAFNEKTGGDAWSDKWNLASKRFTGNYPGVITCGEKVVEISLVDNNLSGELPADVLGLPKLERLNLYNNRLFGDLNGLFSAEMLPDNLVELNLGRNLLGGSIPQSINNLASLKKLNLSYNAFSAIEAALPTAIEYLDLRYQTIGNRGMKKLSTNYDVDLITSLSSYDHAGQSFDSRPSFSLYRNENYGEMLWFSADKYKLTSSSTDHTLLWNYPSETEFTFVQEEGVAAGSTFVLQLAFEQGDANIDQAVDILDVQHSLNYLLMNNPSPFNFVAADSYSDHVITVQDIVATVNIVLESDMDQTSDSRAPYQANRAKGNSSVNELFIVNGTLILQAQEEIAAMDVTINGISVTQIEMLLNNSDYQYMLKQIDGGVRVVIFSLTGEVLPIGSVSLARLPQQSNVAIVRADLTNAAAQRVPAHVNTNPTNVETDNLDGISINVSDDRICCDIPVSAGELILSFYSSQGVLEKNAIVCPEKESGYCFDIPSDMSPGLYILNLKTTLDGREVSRNVKLIISK